MRDCPDQFDPWACLDYRFIDAGKPSPFWASPFPRKGILDCISVERGLNTTKHVCINFCLLLTVDVM